MSSAFSYWRYRLTHRERIDYVDMGLGIKSRYARCRRHWEAHLRLSKSFQEEAIRLSPGGRSIAILGAGRLLDVPIEALLERYDTLHLYDADPSAAASWRWAAAKWKGRVKGHLADLTGSIDRWTSEMRNALRRRSGNVGEEELRDLLSSLELSPVSFDADALVSLNLLSQLSIYWRGRVIDLLRKARVRALTRDEEVLEPLKSALERSERLLQEGHIEALGRSCAALVIVISDRYFHYYRRDHSSWRTDSAHAVEGWELEGRSLLKRDSWLWHIAPQGVEERDYGSIHEVEARAYSRTSRGQERAD